MRLKTILEDVGTAPTISIGPTSSVPPTKTSDMYKPSTRSPTPPPSDKEFLATTVSSNNSSIRNIASSLVKQPFLQQMASHRDILAHLYNIYAEITNTVKNPGLKDAASGVLQGTKFAANALNKVVK